MHTFKVRAWNCGGLRASTPSTNKKTMFFEKEFKTDFDIFVFLETHHKTKNDIPPDILRYQTTHHIIHTKVAEKDTHTGILALISKDFDIIKVNNLIQGRVLNIKIRNTKDKKQLNISAVYLHTNNHITKAKVEEVVTKLKQENEEHPNNIIVGDFNFIDHEKDKINGLNSADKLACKSWQPFLAETDMVDPFREHNPKRRIWSFIGTGKAGNSRIDRVYVNAINMINVKNTQYIQTPFGGHRILSFTIKDQNKTGKGYYKLNTSILTDAKYKKLVQETIEELEHLAIQDEIEQWQTLLLTIRSKSICYSQKKAK